MRISLIGAAFLLAACNQGPAESEHAADAVPITVESRPQMGLMTGLPLYWPLDADFADLAAGDADIPWQRAYLERDQVLVLLDTLSPISAIGPYDPEIDPLADLDRLAVIQPRGLSPSDNLALDEWVRAGGRLLIALDPMLTGDYDVPLGDPRRPNDTAIIPPVISRWGIASVFSRANPEIQLVDLPNSQIPVWMGSELSEGTLPADDYGCAAHQSGLIMKCAAVGKGSVTYIGDAALFEHRDLAGENGEAITALLDFAFND